MNRFVRIAALLIVAAAYLVGSGHPSATQNVAQAPLPEPAETRSLAAVKKEGVLRLATVRGSRAYFLHRGRPAGLEYELVERLAGEIGVELDPHPVDSSDEATSLIVSGMVDVAVVPANASASPGTVVVHPPGEQPSTQLLVHHRAPRLRAALADSLQRSGRDGFARILTQRYARLGRSAAKAGNRISDYDDLIARHAGGRGLDWRLVAAVIAEESRFDPEALSERGATGLMQVMPAVAQDHEIDDPRDPDANIRAGVAQLRRLIGMFPGPDGKGNLPLVLAAYLLGPGHVLDARTLARGRGEDPEAWEAGMDRILPLLEEPGVYERTAFGYAKGRLAVRYVNRILRRYEIYKRHVGEGVEARLRPARMRSDSSEERTASAARTRVTM